MITALNEDLAAFERLAWDFASKELVPDREKNDKYPFGPFYEDVLRKAYEVGFLGITLPEELGGSGNGLSALCSILYNICRADAGLGGIIFVNSFAQTLVQFSGAMSLLKDILSGAKNAGEYIIAFPAFNNPSEIEHVVRAHGHGDGYSISGTLEYLVLGGIARYGIIPAKIDDDSGYSFFLADLCLEGTAKSGPVFSLGFHSCPAVDIVFSDAACSLLGERGMGNRYLEETSNHMYTAAASISAGIMKGCFDEACEYMNERFQGGRKIIDWSALRMYLADMAVCLNAADMIILAACQCVERLIPGWEEKALSAAVCIQNMACDATTDGIQVLGGYGYMKDYGQEKRFRDAKQAQSLMGLAPLKKLKIVQRIIEPK